MHIELYLRMHTVYNLIICLHVHVHALYTVLLLLTPLLCASSVWGVVHRSPHGPTLPTPLHFSNGNKLTNLQSTQTQNHMNN